MTGQTKARLVLALGAVLLALGLSLLGRLRLNWHAGPDAAGYAELASAPPLEILASHRTLGYPLLLAVVRVVSPDFSLLPAVQVLLYVVGVALFQEGLLRSGLQWRIASAATLPLLCSSTLYFANAVLTDTPGCALAIASVGSLLTFVAVRRWLPLVVLALLVFASYQVRPAYLFLVPTVPVLGALLAYHALPGRSAARSLRLAVALAAATTLPLLTFCSVRWMLVRDFAVVSFAGTNLVGIAGQFASADVLPRLPEEQRTLVKRVLNSDRYQKSLSSIEHALTTTGEIGAPRDSQARMRNRAVVDHAYDATVAAYRAEALAIANERRWLTTAASSQVAIDRSLLDTARSLIRAAPELYATYVLKNFLRGMNKALLRQPAILLMGFVLAVAVVFPPDRNARFYETGEMRLAVGLLVPVVILYATAATALVALVEPTIDRYTDAAGVFGSSLFGVATLGAAQSLSRRPRSSQEEDGER